MITKRFALSMGMLFMLLVVYACGGAAPTVAPTPPREEPAAPAEPAAPPSTQANAPEVYSYESPAQAESYAPKGAPPGSEGGEPYDMFFEDYGVNP